MERSLRIKLGGFLFAVVTSIVMNAQAVGTGIVWIDSSGAPVSAPAVLNGTQEGVFFTETETGPQQGFYDVTNNTVDYRLLAFGISNIDTQAWIETLGSNFGCGPGNASSWCYGAHTVTAADWDNTVIDFDNNTGQEIFGDFTNVLDPGDNTINFYRADDGDLGPGDSWDGFLWGDALASSQMFVVLEDSSGTTIYGSGIQPSAVPLPAAIWLLGGALAALRLRRRTI